MCTDCQALYDGWLTRTNDVWRGQCYQCLAKGGRLYAGCPKCVASLQGHRDQQRALACRQLDLIHDICTRRHQ